MACVKNNNRLYQKPWVCNFAPSAQRPQCSLHFPPFLTPAPLGVGDAVVADTSHTTADSPPPLLLFLILMLLTDLRNAGKCACVRTGLVLEIISPL